MNKKVLISTSSFGKEDRRPLLQLEKEGFQISLNPYGRQLTVAESKELLPGVDGLIAGTEKLSEEVLRVASSLRYIVRLGAGMDNVNTQVARDLMIEVENTPDSHVNGVAELALGGILSSLRGIAESDGGMKRGKWIKPMGTLLREKTIGLIGLGKIARALVQLLVPFNCRIIAYDPFFDAAFGKEFGIQEAPLKEIYGHADIISLHVPLTPENRNLIGRDELLLMKENVLLVNTSRGGIVDEQALNDFLVANPFAHAYLDTFEMEPYEGPLAILPNILLTAHIGTYAKEVRLNMEFDAVNRLIKYFKKSWIRKKYL